MKRELADGANFTTEWLTVLKLVIQTVECRYRVRVCRTSLKPEANKCAYHCWQLM
ncbi:MAG: hypothetical protein F6K56_18535 [Moorea sp. SIO3G5]|nr:hypothetical protein [Moorena sp. SIO3G5]